MKREHPKCFKCERPTTLTALIVSKADPIGERRPFCAKCLRKATK